MPLPIDLDSDIAVGITLPIRGSSQSGYFNQSFTTLDQVTSNVINLLLTIPGERLMQPTFGSKLHEHLFEQLDEFTSEVIKDSIEESIKEWLPYVVIEELDVTDGGDLTDNQSYHTIRVSLTISITADPETHMTITLRSNPENGSVKIESISSNNLESGGGSKNSLGKSSKDTYNTIKKHNISPIS